MGRPPGSSVSPREPSWGRAPDGRVLLTPPASSVLSRPPQLQPRDVTWTSRRLHGPPGHGVRRPYAGAPSRHADGRSSSGLRPRPGLPLRSHEGDPSRPGLGPQPRLPSHSEMSSWLFRVSLRALGGGQKIFGVPAVTTPPQGFPWSLAKREDTCLKGTLRSRSEPWLSAPDGHQCGGLIRV